MIVVEINLTQMRYNSYNNHELDRKMNAKLIGLMELLEEKGTELREPYSAPLEDGIFELRCKLGSNITRALYFFYVGKRRSNEKVNSGNTIKNGLYGDFEEIRG